MVEKSPKKLSPKKEDWESVIASKDPTSDKDNDLENMAREAIKKFKSL